MEEPRNNFVALPAIGVATLRFRLQFSIASVAVNAAVADSKIAEAQLVARAAVLALADSAKVTARAIAEADAFASIASEHATACTGIVSTLEASLLPNAKTGSPSLRPRELR